MEGLHFGVPLVAVPQMAGQRANADRIAELGLGAALPPDEVTAETLWQAVEDFAWIPLSFPTYAAIVGRAASNGASADLSTRRLDVCGAGCMACRQAAL